MVISLNQRFNSFNYDCLFLVHRRARISFVIDNFINIVATRCYFRPRSTLLKNVLSQRNRASEEHRTDLPENDTTT